MASHYNDGDTGLSEEQIDTFVDMEEAYDRILEISVEAEDENQNNPISGFIN